MALPDKLLPDLGPFRPTRLLGEGKTGQVFLAELPGRPGLLAVKVLKPELARDEAALKRFVEAAKALIQLQHPNVGRLFEVRRLDGNRVVVAMEYLAGQDLSAHIAEHGTMDPDTVADLGHQLCKGLAAVHAAGLCHLDLGPRHVLLCQDDSGARLAKILGAGMAGFQASHASQRPDPYRSPEQREGRPGDARSDLYSLGAMLYEALSGMKPRRSGFGQQIARPTRGTVIPLRLEALVFKCLAADPEERPESAEKLAGALSVLLPQLEVPDLATVPGEGDADPTDETTKKQETEIARVCPECGARFPPEIDFCSNDGARLPAPTVVPVDPNAADLPRTVGAYRLQRLIGEGGMGRVYLAEHTLLGRRVALKMLLPEYSRDASTVSRFFHEARVVNQIGHDNIVDITDFVENVGGDNYYVMEYLDGTSLKTAMREDGRFGPERVLRIGAQIADALAAAHEAGAIHRDLKPDNIFLLEKRDNPDFVKLLDFGIAKLIDAEGMSLQTTIEGAVLGTPEYMSPEQASGEVVDARTDIYSLGVMLYAMAVGKLPIEAPNYAQLLIKLIGTEPKRPADLDEPVLLPASIEALIMRCLAKDPDERYQTMGELQLELDACEDELGGGAVARPTRPAASRKLGLVALLLLPLAVVGYYLFGRGEEPPPDEAAASAAADSAGNKTGAAVNEKEVTVAFSSEPAGAEVFRGEAKKPLGRTPFSTALAPSDEPIDFVFRLDGHAAATEHAAIAEGTKIHAELTPRQAKKPKKRRKKKAARKGKRPKKKKKKKKGSGPVDEDETLDPFAL